MACPWLDDIDEKGDNEALEKIWSEYVKLLAESGVEIDGVEHISRAKLLSSISWLQAEPRSNYRLIAAFCVAYSSRSGVISPYVNSWNSEVSCPGHCLRAISNVWSFVTSKTSILLGLEVVNAIGRHYMELYGDIRDSLELTENFNSVLLFACNDRPDIPIETIFNYLHEAVSVTGRFIQPKDCVPFLMSLSEMGGCEILNKSILGHALDYRKHSIGIDGIVWLDSVVKQFEVDSGSDCFNSSHAMVVLFELAQNLNDLDRSRVCDFVDSVRELLQALDAVGLDKDTVGVGSMAQCFLNKPDGVPYAKHTLSSLLKIGAAHTHYPPSSMGYLVEPGRYCSQATSSSRSAASFRSPPGMPKPAGSFAFLYEKVPAAGRTPARPQATAYIVT